MSYSMLKIEWLTENFSKFYIVFTKLPSPQFTEVRFVFCFFLLLTDGWLARQEFSATSSQNKQRWPGENISITWYPGTPETSLSPCHHAIMSPRLSCFRYTRNEESLVEWLVRISRRSAPSRRVPIRSSCQEDVAKCVLVKMTVSLYIQPTTHPPSKRCQTVFL